MGQRGTEMDIERERVVKRVEKNGERERRGTESERCFLSLSLSASPLVVSLYW